MIMTSRTAGKRFMTAAILGIVCLAFSPLTNVRAADEDSAQVSALLSQTKLEAIRLREDANQMKDFVRSNVAWDTHAAYSGLIADDIVAMLDKINQLDRARSSGSAWQQNAIDKIKPLMKELAATTEALAKAMLEKPIDRTEFNEYLQANYDNAEQLAALISNFVDYGKAKHRLEASAAKLKLDSTAK
jgi:hypothetical protein